MGTGNEWIVLLAGLAAAALVVWGVWALIRSAVRSGVRAAGERDRRGDDG